MGAGWRRAVNAARATQGKKPLPSWKVYHQATVRPFSATLEREFSVGEAAIFFAEGLRGKRSGRVTVANPKGLTVWSFGEPGPDQETTT